MPIQRLKPIESNNYNDVDFTKLKEDLSIWVDKFYDKPPICIEIVQNGKRYRFGTKGNFSVTGGKGKTRKTFVSSIILASALSGSKINNFVCTFNKEDIVFFDTEQSPFDLYWSAKRAVKLNKASHHPGNYKVFCLRPLSPIERTMFIENYLEENKNIGLIIIDGIRDLITDINNPDQSIDIVTKLMAWTKTYNIHINVVLHENPGSEKLRGHLGTEITNKAETVISTVVPTEKKDITIIKPQATRGTIPFEEFAFTINEEGLPELTNIDLFNF